MLLMLLAVMGLDAHAQDAVTPPDLDAQMYRIPIDSRYTLWTEDSVVGPAGAYSLRAGYHYANKPLIYVPFDETQPEVAVLDDVSEFDVGLGISTGPIRLGAALPVFFGTDGAFVDSAGSKASGFGDVDLEAKLGLNQARRRTSNERGAPGLALSVGVGLPTGSVDAPVKSPNATFSALAVLDGDVGREGRTHVGGNLGFQRVPLVDLGGADASSGEQLESLLWQNLLLARFGVGYAVTPDWGVSGDWVFSSEATALFNDKDGQPMEFLGGIWSQLGDSGLRLNAGAGFSPYKAVAGAQARAIIYLTYNPDTVKPEPVPDVDVTLLIQDHDGDPIDNARTEVSLDDGAEYGGHTLHFTVHPGSYAVAAAADGYAPLDDSFAVPDVEHYEVIKVMDALIGQLNVHVVDMDGNPIPDAWFQVGDDKPVPTTQGDGETEVDPGEFIVTGKAEGYRPASVPAELQAGGVTIVTIPLEKSKAYATQQAIIITDKVHFDFDKYSIRRDSYAILDDVVRVLVEHPEIQRVRVEGHTDIRGSLAYNDELSDNRARSVRNYLVDHGIKSDRVEYRGYGERVPVDPAHNEAAWAKNRRVEFTILTKGPNGWQEQDMTRQQFSTTPNGQL